MEDMCSKMDQMALADLTTEIKTEMEQEGQQLQNTLISQLKKRITGEYD